MCIPILKLLETEEILARMNWEVREAIDEKRIIPYGLTMVEIVEIFREWSST